MADVTSEIEERRVVLTENAARRIAMLKAQESAENAFLRIAVLRRRLLPASSTGSRSTTSATTTIPSLRETVSRSSSTMSRWAC